MVTKTADRLPARLPPVPPRSFAHVPLAPQEALPSLAQEIARSPFSLAPQRVYRFRPRPRTSPSSRRPEAFLRFVQRHLQLPAHTSSPICSPPRHQSLSQRSPFRRAATSSPSGRRRARRLPRACPCLATPPIPLLLNQAPPDPQQVFPLQRPKARAAGLPDPPYGSFWYLATRRKSGHCREPSTA